MSIVNCQRGQTLIEAIIALTIAVAIISAIAIVVISSLGSSQFSTSQNLSNQHAQEGLYFVKGIRDGSWSKFTGYNNIYYCFDESASDLSPRAGFACSQNVGIFSREVRIEHDHPVCTGGSRVTVIVSWSDNKCTDRANPLCHKVELVSCLININAVPTP